MRKLTITFEPGQKLSAEKLNDIVDKINEVVDYINEQNANQEN